MVNLMALNNDHKWCETTPIRPIIASHHMVNIFCQPEVTGSAGHNDQSSRSWGGAVVGRVVCRCLVLLRSGISTTTSLGNDFCLWSWDNIDLVLRLQCCVCAMSLICTLHLVLGFHFCCQNSRWINNVWNMVTSPTKHCYGSEQYYTPPIEFSKPFHHKISLSLE